MDIGELIVQKLAVREKAREIATACIEVTNGERNDLEAVCRIFDTVDEVQEEEQFVPVSDDIEEIIAQVEKGVKWAFNIETLKRHISGIGPGLFTVIAARPEVGKTAAWVSLCAGEGGFAEQGAKINAYINEEPAVRTKARLVSCTVQMDLSEVKEKISEVRNTYSKFVGKINCYDSVALTFSELTRHVRETKPDIVVIDQLDKVKLDEDFNSGHERLREVYIQARELAKAHNIAVIGISQLSADAEDKFTVDYSMLEGSKTGKAAEADLIICIGANRNAGEWLRQWNLSKNKITGDHSSVMLKLKQGISRYDV